MSYAGQAKEIPNRPTPLGIPVGTLQYPNGSKSYLYGDFLPQTSEERRELEMEIARAVEWILSECETTGEEGKQFSITAKTRDNSRSDGKKVESFR